MAKTALVKGYSLSQFQAWALKKNHVDYDGYYGAQCVDLARAWIYNNSWPQLPPLGSNTAKYWWGMTLPKGWVKIKNAASNFPPAGALPLFGARGHVDIARPGCTASKLYGLDQNWDEWHAVSLVTHNYTNDKVIGWLVYRG